MDKLLLLSQISLLEELPMDDLKTVEELSEMKPVKKGTIILSPDKPIEALFFFKERSSTLISYESSWKTVYC